MQILKGLERSVKKLVPQGWKKHFRASKYELLMERRAPVDLVVHVGAHWGEDAAFYERCGAKTILWVEADPSTYEQLNKALSSRPKSTRHVTENALVSATDGEELTFNRFNGDGASSSVYASTETYRERFPHSHETGEVIQLTSRSLPEILARHQIEVTTFKRPMLVVDVQGHELSVLKGLGEGLKQFSQCKCEVSRIPMYDGGAQFTDIDAHMTSMGFRLASHRYVQVPRHGDVLYIQD